MGNITVLIEIKSLFCYFISSETILCTIFIIYGILIIKMGIARVLCEVNPEYRPALKKEGLMTRDSRMVERKKFGKAKARRSFQFSKR